MNSDLQDFVKETLVQIVRGIAAAQAEVKDQKAIINPELGKRRVKSHHEGGMEDIFGLGYRLDTENLERGKILETANGKTADIVEFDVAITTTAAETDSEHKSSDKGGAVRLQVVSAEIGVASETSHAKQLTDAKLSRIRFKIPVMFPQ